MTIVGNKVRASKSFKLLGVNIDKNLKFDEHIKDICSKARSICFAFSRIRKFLTVDKARLLYNAVILSNFSYCPLIWMFCSKSDNTLINNRKQFERVKVDKSEKCLTQ